MRTGRTQLTVVIILASAISAVAQDGKRLVELLPITFTAVLQTTNTTKNGSASDKPDLASLSG